MLRDNLSKTDLEKQLCLFENKGSKRKVKPNNVVYLNSFLRERKEPSISPSKLVEAFSSHASSIPWLNK